MSDLLDVVGLFLLLVVVAFFQSFLYCHHHDSYDHYDYYHVLLMIDFVKICFVPYDDYY